MSTTLFNTFKRVVTDKVASQVAMAASQLPVPECVGCRHCKLYFQTQDSNDPLDYGVDFQVTFHCLLGRCAFGLDVEHVNQRLLCKFTTGLSEMSLMDATVDPNQLSLEVADAIKESLGLG